MLYTLQRLATGRNVLVLNILAAIMMFGVMPVLGRKLAAVAGSLPPLDLNFPTFSPEKAFETLTAYGEAGRAFYRNIEISVDIIYPLLYGTAYALFIAFLWKRLAPNARWIIWLPVFPLLIILSDLCENAGIVTLIQRFPEQPIGLAKLTGTLTLLKWSFFLITAVLMLTGAIGLGIKRLSKR